MSLKVTYKDYDTALKAAKMFELRNQVSLSVLSGNFRNARAAQRELAETASDNFDVYKTLPSVKITNIPLKEWFVLAFRSLEYKAFRLFSKKTPKEKLFSEQWKSYIKSLKRH